MRQRFPWRVCGMTSTFVQLAVLGAPRSGLPAACRPEQQYQPPPDGTWTSNATIEVANAVTRPRARSGARGSWFAMARSMGMATIVFATPRVGVMKEYDLELRPTGRSVRLTQNGKPLTSPPDWATFDPRWGTLLATR